GWPGGGPPFLAEARGTRGRSEEGWAAFGPGPCTVEMWARRPDESAARPQRHERPGRSCTSSGTPRTSSSGESRHERQYRDAPSPRPPEPRKGTPMSEQPYVLTVGVDWADRAHRVVVLDVQRQVVAEWSVAHTGAALREWATRLTALAGGEPAHVAV